MATKGPEYLVKQEIKRQLALLENCWYFMPEQGGYGRAGIHDFVGCYRGRAFCIEAKAEGGKLSAHQRREIAAARDAGAFSEVIQGMDEARCVAPRLRVWAESEEV